LEAPHGHEEANLVRTVAPQLGADWLSTRNRALRFRLVEERGELARFA
jgi:hypothetical protein